MARSAASQAITRRPPDDLDVRKIVYAAPQIDVRKIMYGPGRIPDPGYRGFLSRLRKSSRRSRRG
jgi:hypothetical protein